MQGVIETLSKRTEMHARIDKDARKVIKNVASLAKFYIFLFSENWLSLLH